jgi:hypothetical protein
MTQSGRISEIPAKNVSIPGRPLTLPSAVVVVVDSTADLFLAAMHTVLILMYPQT